MRASLLSFVFLATTVSGLRFNHPSDQQPLQTTEEQSSLTLWSDELGLANKNLISPNLPYTAYPAPNASELVKPVLKSLKVDNLKKNLWTFTSFLTRNYLQPEGKSSQKWLIKQIQEIIANSSASSVGVTEFKHLWPQSSVIARINGSTNSDELIILGAHLDSAVYGDPALRAPGADDDGSGTMTILEAFRGLLAANFTPARSVEFHWYSAEEAGLYGSDAVAREYRAQNASVIAQMQFDMTAWVKNGTEEEIGLFSNWADLGLVDLQKKLINQYVDIPWYESALPGDAGSDHMSWTRIGYPAVCVSESRFEHANLKWIHTVNDRIDISPEFSFDHMLHFSKLAAAYAIELGGWKKD